MESKEKEQETWRSAEKTVSELIADSCRQSRRWFIAFLITLAALVATNAYWIHVFNSYEYVNQDGDGHNYYNNDIGGDVKNGAEN